MAKKDLNPSELINEWTLEHFKEMFVLVDGDGKEIEFEVHVEKPNERPN
jgi:hypothetical protein